MNWQKWLLPFSKILLENFSLIRMPKMDKLRVQFIYGFQHPPSTPRGRSIEMEQEPLKDAEQSGWIQAFFRELVTMPRRHIMVFVIATLVLIFLEVELTEGWHLFHIIEVLGGVVFCYLIWAAWRAKK